MRLRALLGAAALIAVGPAAEAQGLWPEYSFPEAGFAAQFPSRPKLEERSYASALVSGGAVRERVYSTDSGGVIYLVSIADFSSTRPNENRAIDEAARAMIARGKLTHDVSARIDWHYGRELRVEDENGTSYTNAIFYIDNKIYQIEVIFPENNSDPVGNSGIHFFQQAFRLLP